MYDPCGAAKWFLEINYSLSLLNKYTTYDYMYAKAIKKKRYIRHVFESPFLLQYSISDIVTFYSFMIT